jgi:Fur family ferric uptake transcriptional regulator
MPKPDRSVKRFFAVQGPEGVVKGDAVTQGGFLLYRATSAARTSMESRIERLCVERGLKMTGQRRVIARVLSEASDHPDVEELYRRAATLDSRISIATVYRTVRLFEEEGILERRDFGGGRARYEPSEHGHHYHLIDVGSGKVIEFQDAEHEALMRTIAERLGFEIVSLRLELFGRRLDPIQPGRTPRTARRGRRGKETTEQVQA